MLPRAVTGQSPGATYCNPIDIDYKYNFEQVNEGISYRSGADPVIINHKGEYFIFVTVSGGYSRFRFLPCFRDCFFSLFPAPLRNARVFRPT